MTGRNELLKLTKEINKQSVKPINKFKDRRTERNKETIKKQEKK